MREGTTSRVTVADRPYGKFYDFYSTSPENFGSTLVFQVHVVDLNASYTHCLLYYKLFLIKWLGVCPVGNI